MKIDVLDTHQLGRPGIIAVIALETKDGIALFDTGPESTFDNVVAELRSAGAKLADVRHVFISHIHLDHAGAAWRFAQLGATVYVHPRGAPHLADPTKLAESASRIFGGEMSRLWGRIAPVPGEKIRIVNDQELVRIAPYEVRAIATPGHANHHHVYAWDKVLFGGDIAGVRIKGGPPVPPFVPPELHVEAWLDSIDKIRAADVETVYLPHFGLVREPIAAHLDALEARVRRWSNWLRDGIRAARSEAQLSEEFTSYVTAEFESHGADEELIRDYETADPSYMAVIAALRYWRKYHPEEISATQSSASP